MSKTPPKSRPAPRRRKVAPAIDVSTFEVATHVISHELVAEQNAREFADRDDSSLFVRDKMPVFVTN